jgi:hypothetical protein
MYEYGLFFGHVARLESSEPARREEAVDFRELRNGYPIDDTMELNFVPVLSLCNRASEGMQDVDIPTVISRQYVK